MNSNNLDQFGEALIKQVRDVTIRHWDKIVNGTMSDEETRIINSLGENEIELVKRLIPKIIDTTLHYLLWKAEQQSPIFLGLRTTDGKIEDISSISDGLSGELYGENGWLKKYSSQRVYNP